MQIIFLINWFHLGEAKARGASAELLQSLSRMRLPITAITMAITAVEIPQRPLTSRISSRTRTDPAAFVYQPRLSFG
jgi:hypothetical protein